MIAAASAVLLGEEIVRRTTKGQKKLSSSLQLLLCYYYYYWIFASAISLTAVETMMKKIRPKMIFYYLQLHSSHQRKSPVDDPSSAAAEIKYYCSADYCAPEEEAD